MTQSSPDLPPRRIHRGELGRVNFEPTTWTLRTLGPVLRGFLRLWTKQIWVGAENLPKSGPVIVVPNHISSLDPPLVGVFLAYNGRWPRFLARANLFDHRPLGLALRNARQIPVQRGSRQAGDALVHAERALADGDVVVIYPEGTITFDPDEWPMAGHTGAARLALRTGAPVVPLGQWGANHALPPRGIRRFRPRRVPVTIVCGPPIDLSQFAGGADDRGCVRAATVLILDEITALAERARGERAPSGRWLPKAKRRVPRKQALI